MKLIKLIAAVIMSLGLMIAQPPNQGGTQQGPPPCDQWLNSNMAHDMNGDGTVDEGDCPGQGGPPQGPPPCDEWLNSNMAHDMNGDGVVDEGDCPGQGPPPFEAVDTNGDGLIDREEARAMFGQDKDGNPDPEFDNRFDNRAGDDGMVDHAEYMAPGGGDHDGPATCDVCGYEYGGPDDHHGHCRVCDAEMNADEDWQSHCEENPDHCKAQAGDVCGFRGWDGQGEECGYVHTGDADEDHHHCDHCGLAVNSGEEMHNHMQADHPDMMGQHDDGGGDHDGQQHFPNNHWDGNCGAMMNGQSEYWLDSDGDPNNGPEDGPYAVWYEDADGNPVNCGPGPEDHGGPATCDVCGHEYSGPDDHHGHCRVCDAEMNADEDWQSHCEENPDHCKAQAGDVCGFRGWDGQGEECGYVHTGDADEDHHHCDHCGLAVNSGEEMHNHMQADHPDMMGQHDDGGGDHDGQQHFPNNHWDGNCGAMMNGQSEYWLDSDGDPNNGPEDGPYAVWHEDADGNPVNCGPGPEDHGGPPECPECGHQYADENDQHGHCPTCGEALNGEADWEDHCTNNEDHCKDPVADAFFNTYAETQDYEAAFNAGAAVAREMAQNEDDYNEDEWNDGRDCFHAAMTSYLDGGGDSPEGAMEAMYQSGCDEGPGGQGGPQGPPPTCEEVDANGDGSIDRDEARAKFGHDP